jgi:hypothetical protein
LSHWIWLNAEFRFFKIFSIKQSNHFKVDPGKYKGIFTGFKVTLKEDGPKGLAKGWAPTAIGYSLQGLGKFGFYELFKNVYANLIGEVLFLSKNR